MPDGRVEGVSSSENVDNAANSRLLNIRAYRLSGTAVAALEDSDTPVITTLDRSGRSTQNMLAFAEHLRSGRQGCGC